MSELQPGWIAPGEKYMLADPVELGWVAAPRPEAPILNFPEAKIDWDYIRSLGHIAGNEYEERKAA